MPQFNPADGRRFDATTGDTRLATEVLPRRRIRIGAVFAGTAIEIVGSLTVALVLVFAFAITHDAPGLTPERLQRMVAESWPMMLAQLVAGLLCTALGGYVAARIGKTLPVGHGLAVGILVALWGVLGCIVLPAMAPAGWVTVTSVALALPAALLGGWIRGLQWQGKTEIQSRRLATLLVAAPIILTLADGFLALFASTMPADTGRPIPSGHQVAAMLYGAWTAWTGKKSWSSRPTAPM